MKVVITGATSMIGRSILDECIDSASVEKIYAVIRKETGRIDRIPKSPKISLIECDIDQYVALPSLINDSCDVFYHIAWASTGEKRNQDPYGQIKNIQFTIDALYAAKKMNCRLFVGAGSQAEYGVTNVSSISPSSSINPTQIYGIAKYSAGKMALETAKTIGICCVWVRVFSVYGIYDKETTMISSVLTKMMKNEHVSMTKGNQLWDYLFSSDAGAAFFKIGNSDIRDNRIYCLGSGKAKKIIEYVNIIKKITNSTSEIGIGELDYKNNVINLCADISDLTKDTGWVPKVSFEEGIRIVYEYFKSN